MLGFSLFCFIISKKEGEDYMKKRITGYTELLALIAKPIRHSISPAMHNAGFRKLGLDYAYLAFEIEKEALEDTIKGLKAMNVRGYNVSMPYKSDVIPFLDKLSPAASLIGAVNTIVNDNGVLTGHITDGIGLMEALKDRQENPVGQKMIIVGSGGAATAIAIQAALDGVKEIVIYNKKDRFFDNALVTAKKIKENTHCIISVKDLDDLDTLKKDMHSSKYFINATNVGMKPMEHITYIPDESYFTKDLFVVDIIYNPFETKLLEMARLSGCQTMNGLGMLLFQGAAAFKIWTGQDMPIEYVKKEIGF